MSFPQRVPSLGREDDGTATTVLESTALAGHGVRCGLETEVSGVFLKSFNGGKGMETGLEMVLVKAGVFFIRE